MQEEHPVFQAVQKFSRLLVVWCVSCGGESVVREAYYDDEAWEKERAEFLKYHPCTKIIDEGEID